MSEAQRTTRMRVPANGAVVSTGRPNTIVRGRDPHPSTHLASGEAAAVVTSNKAPSLAKARSTCAGARMAVAGGGSEGLGGRWVSSMEKRLFQQHNMPSLGEYPLVLPGQVCTHWQGWAAAQPRRSRAI